MKKVTDPELLSQLEGPRGQPKKVTDPELLAQLEEQEPKGAIRQTIENIPGSAINFARSVVQPIIHPVDTVRGLQRLVSGAAQKIPGVSEILDASREKLPGFMARQVGTREDIPVAENVGQFYKERFGGLSNLRETAITDPVGLMADVAAVAGLAGLGLRASGAGKAADIATKASKAVDPLSIVGKTVKPVAKLAYKQVVGTTTGAGARVIDEALKGGKSFTDAMRGKTSEAQVVGKAKDALDDIRQARGDLYRTRLKNLKGAKQRVPIVDIKNLADEQLKRFNVKVTNKGLDFSRSTASGKSASEIEEVYKLVKDWGSQPGDLTPAMLDVLKRRLDDFYAEGRTSRAMVTTLKKAVQDKIVKKVPEYAQMTKDYAKTTELIKEMESALGAGKRTTADTALRKMIMAVKEDKSFRSDMLKVLGGEDLTGAAAGVAMSPTISRSLGSMATSITSGGAALASSSPLLAGLMALASPRVVGELSVLLGRLGKAAPYGRGGGIFAYQAGRLPIDESQAP